MATRLLSAYAKTYGSEYMKTTLHKAMETMVNKPAEAKTFELDPSKVESGEDIARNKQNVIDTTDLFLNAICASTNDAPRFVAWEFVVPEGTFGFDLPLCYPIDHSVRFVTIS
jgi:neurofibromin 1